MGYSRPICGARIMSAVRQSQIQFIVNLNAAKAMGLTLPITLLGRADEVIE